MFVRLIRLNWVNFGGFSALVLGTQLFPETGRKNFLLGELMDEIFDCQE